MPTLINEIEWGEPILSVVGDTINVASRIEALTRALGVDLLISETLKSN